MRLQEFEFVCCPLPAAPCRLNDELDESCRKLGDLTTEQMEEKKKWKDELAELKQQMEQLKKEAEEAQRLALQDEVAAVEQQRDVAMAHIQKWQREVQGAGRCCTVAKPARLNMHPVVFSYPDLPVGAVPEHLECGYAQEVPQREATVGEEGGFGAAEPDGAAEPLRGGPAAAPPGSRVRVPAQDQCARAATDPNGETERHKCLLRSTYCTCCLESPFFIWLILRKDLVQIY